MSPDQVQAPLFAALLDYVRRRPAVFHVPGHCQGRGAPPEWRQFLGARALSVDLTEVAGLDDLHAPEGVIARAQELAAAAFGAWRSHFLVGGTTAGLQALLLAACRPGDTVVVPRHAHRAVLGGLILSGARPVYVRPAYDTDLDIPLGAPPQALKEALGRHPEARAVVAVHPTYHGIPARIAELAAVAHQHGVPLLVDEAHGAHFRFHPELPTAALAAGADATVQSLHKTGGSLTQSSLLHLGAGGRVDPDLVQAMLRLVQSSSPSYLLMASLDLARRDLACHGRSRWERALALAAGARRRLNRLPGIRAVAFSGGDPTRLVVDVGARGISGAAAAAALWRDYGVATELAGQRYFLALLGPGSGRRDVDRLVRAVAGLPPAGPPPAALGEPPWPQVALTPREAFLGAREAVPLDQAGGRMAAELVVPYPPGIPVLAPGECITPDVISYLRRCAALGQHLQGPADPALQTILVVRE